MTKKNSSTKNTNLPRRLREDLYQADTLITEGKPEQALKILHELEDKFPRQSDILGLMAVPHSAASSRNQIKQGGLS